MRLLALGLVVLLVPLAGCLGGTSSPFKLNDVEGAATLSGENGVTVATKGKAVKVGLDHELTLAAANGTAGIRIPAAGNRSAEHLLWSDKLAGFDLSSGLVADGPVLARVHVGTAQTVKVANADVSLVTAAVEGTEVTVFLRGSGKLANGTATILFPAEFGLLVGPGPLTVQLTLTSPGSGLYVAEKAPDGFRAATSDATAQSATFDYFVQATRAGTGGFRAVR